MSEKREAMNTSEAEGSKVVAAAPKRLDASAPAFRPVYSDNRCLFLTFSNGFPLTESQIFNFFNSLYAPYVENVYVHKPRVGGRHAKPSLFGKVTFKQSLIPDLVMGNKEKVCFSVDGFPLYCRRFVTQKTETGESSNAATATASNSPHDGGSDHGGDGGSDHGGDGGSDYGGDGGSDHGGDGGSDHGGDGGSDHGGDE